MWKSRYLNISKAVESMFIKFGTDVHTMSTSKVDFISFKTYDNQGQTYFSTVSTHLTTKTIT